LAESEAPKKAYVLVLLFANKEDAENCAMYIAGNLGVATTVVHEPLTLEELQNKFAGSATLYTKNPDAKEKGPSYIA